MPDPFHLALDHARRGRPAPLPRDFADRVLRQAARQVERLPAIASRSGMMTTGIAAVTAAALVAWAADRPAPSSEPPALGSFSTPLLASP